MIDLKKKIEELLESSSKFYHKTANINFKMCLQGQVEAYQDCLNVINNYNIITAPKTIKLSQILDRLNKEHKKTINGNIIFEYKINRNGRYNTDGTPYHLTDTTIDSYYYGKKLLTVIKFNKKMDITILDFGDNFKWLYALWLTGTIIEDDLKEE